MRARWVLMAAATLSACAGVRWGEGGPEPTRSTAGALMLTLDQPGLTRASTRLAEGVAERWADGLQLSPVAGELSVDWRAWAIHPGAPRLELIGQPVQHAEQSSPVDLGLMVHVPVAAAEHDVVLMGLGLDAACSMKVRVSAGELDVPMTFSADKLGRVQGLVLQGAAYRALSEVTPNAILEADFSGCGGAIEPGARLAALGSAFARAAVAAVSDTLAAELPAALGLDLAFTWSGTVGADSLGTGFMRSSLRALPSTVVRRRGGAVEVAFSLSFEAEPHPCMGMLTLAAPSGDPSASGFPPGAALHVDALERAVAAGWLGGMACADHLGRVPIEAAPLAAVWPALARMGDDAEVSLELWPAALPRVSPGARANELTLETGRVRADIIVTWGGARWRAASIELQLEVAGSLWIDANGGITLDPSQVEALPSAVEAGLIEAPGGDAVALFIAPLVEALFIDRPLAVLPDPLIPASVGPITLQGDYLTWLPR